MDPVDYDLDDDPARIQRDVVWDFLSTRAYWGRWRTRDQLETQIDGIGFAYLADVFVLDDHRGQSLGKRLLRLMIDDGPGADMRWTLFTGDAHGLYRQFGFHEPDVTAMVRPARQGT